MKTHVYGLKLHRTPKEDRALESLPPSTSTSTENFNYPVASTGATLHRAMNLNIMEKRAVFTCPKLAKTDLYGAGFQLLIIYEATSPHRCDC